MNEARPLVAINVSQLSPGRAEGVVTYMRQLLFGLEHICDNEQLIVIAQPGMDLGKTQLRVVELARPALVERVLNKLMAISGLYISTARTSKLNAILRENNVDIIHYPFSTIPPSDFKIVARIVLSIMDVQHEFLPELFTKSQMANRRASFSPSAKRADHCISISEYTTKTVVNLFGIDQNKITTVPLAGDVSNTPKVPSDLPKSYMYLPAGNWKHKNHERLFEALRRLKSQGFTGKLVLTGLRSQDKLDLVAMAADYNISDLVIDMGQVTFDEVAGIYSKAKLLIYPTLFEGFGIPALEAMSVGLPVACSNTTSLPEIVGDAAETFNPESVDEIMASIQKVWSDDEYRKELIIRGYKQAAKFSWDKTAKKTYQVYKDVYEQTK